MHSSMSRYNIRDPTFKHRGKWSIDRNLILNVQKVKTNQINSINPIDSMRIAKDLEKSRVDVSSKC